jgi:hypothetical protein
VVALPPLPLPPPNPSQYLLAVHQTQALTLLILRHCQWVEELLLHLLILNGSTTIHHLLLKECRVQVDV